MPAPVAPLGRQILLAIAPMAIADRHADAGIRVHHLLGRDHFQLVGIGVQPKPLGRGGDDRVIALDQLKRPVRRIGQWAVRPHACGQQIGRHGAALRAIGCKRRLALPMRVAARQRRVLGEIHTETPSFLNRSRNTG
ncbi:hypothetical protein SDC9_117238 [bioreactor metagenome]|uniref:Uncharacterized protein n=1 Tax=bioreactor metagenome TaxID=1076179 RepID=A0A645C4K6_9ZZZZ